MGRFRRYLATSDEPVVKSAREAYRALQRFTLPAPKVVVKPMLWAYLANRSVAHFALRIFVAEPLLKAYCKSYGKGVTTDISVHWISGKGDIVLGDYVRLDGKCTITFASRFSDTPTLEIGDHSGLSDECVLTIGKRITIGKHCLIAAGVTMMDSYGHASDPASRMQGAAPGADEVKPITICDNVWIGRQATIFPGVTVGEGSIISSGAVVMADVAPYTIVAGNPARRIGTLPKPGEPANGNAGQAAAASA